MLRRKDNVVHESILSLGGLFPIRLRVLKEASPSYEQSLVTLGDRKVHCSMTINECATFCLEAVVLRRL